MPVVSGAPTPLDASQRAVLASPADASALVLGAPGSGKTTTLVELAAQRVLDDGLHPHELLVLAAGRHQATALRERLAARIPVVTTAAWARTTASIAFEAVTARARAESAPAPRLLSGAEHDLVIRDLLDAETDDAWPDHLDAEVRRLPGFRTELRELMMRAVEHGVDGDGLAALGRRTARPEWMSAGRFMRAYAEVVAQSHPAHLDPAELMAFAAQAVHDGLAGERLAAVRLVLVDDVQEVPEGALGVLRALAERGVAIVAFGDPDLAANTFRGAGAETVSGFFRGLGRPGIDEFVLAHVHRHGPTLRTVVGDVARRIGTAGVWRQRAAQAVAADGDAPAAIVLQPSSWALGTAIGRELRERHVLDGVPWNELAVVVRSRSEIPVIERRLAAAQVPTRSTAVGRPLREHPEAAALLRLVEVATRRAPLGGELAAELLLGPFGGLDAVGLRRLRLSLRAEALVHGDERPSRELLAEALRAPGGFTTIDHPSAHRAARLAAALARIAAQAETGASAEELLWTAWESSRVADAWRALALGSGVAADEAGRALDGVVELFAAARRFAENRPDGGARDFLDEVLDAEVPSDVLAPRPNADAVLVTTPAGTVGFEFDTVVVAGVQDGRWPDLRLRGSLLGAPQLVDTVTGIDTATLDARRLVLDDELRLLAVAVSRARRRVVLAAVESDDELPSPVIRMLQPLIPTFDAPVSPLTLRSLVARMRQTLTRDTVRDERLARADAAATLALLASESIPGADPAGWRGLTEPSTTAPLVELGDPDARVRVSPSRIEALDRSPMEWFVESYAGGSSGLAAGIGTIVHDVLEHAVTPEQQHVEALWSALLERWNELEFPAPWLAEQQQRLARRAIEAIAAYLAAQRAEGVALVSSEQSFEFDEGQATLAGKIDRVELDAGRIRIVDLKTGTPKKAADVVDDPQLSAYQLAYARGEVENLPEHHEPGGARLLYSRSTRASEAYTALDQPVLTTERLEAFAERVRRAAVEMVGPGYDATIIDDPFQRRGAELREIHLPGEVSSD